MKKRLHIKLKLFTLWIDLLDDVKLHSLGKGFSIQEDSVVGVFSEFSWKIISLTVFEVCFLIWIYVSMLALCLKGLRSVFATG